MSETVLLYRDTIGEPEEFEAAQRVWGDRCHQFRSQIPTGASVIGRYSVYPHYKELVDELALRDASLPHSHETYQSLRDMRWYDTISDLTFDTWINEGWQTVPECEHGYVVKGTTRSRKWQWDDMMRAKDRDELREVMSRLRYDSRIAEQDLAIREYVPLEQIGTGINGLPLANEGRCFFWNGERIASGFYWAIAECAPEMGECPDDALAVAQQAADLLHAYTFVAIDVARTQEGAWQVVEVNGGQMSGLSMIDPQTFYERLQAVVSSFESDGLPDEDGD